MVNQNLKEYLGNILDLEQSILLRTSLINRMETEEIDKPEIMPYQSPSLARLQKPKEPKKPERTVVDNKISKPLMIFVLVIAAPLIGSIIGLFIARFFDEAYRNWFALGGIIIGEIIGYFYVRSTKSNRKVAQLQEQYNKAYETDMDFYRKDMERYDKKLEKYEREAQRQSEIREKSEKEYDEYLSEKNALIKAQEQLVQSEINQLKEKNRESEELLNKYYSLGNIHRDYVGDITALSSFYDYIDKGICYDLEGKDEAYSRYERDKMIKEIINYEKAQTYLLENIGHELNAIRNNQHTLYNLLQENNDTSKRILRSHQDALSEIKDFKTQSSRQADDLNRLVKKMADSSAVTAYNSERSRKEIEYLRRVDDLENGRWYNF